MSCIYQRKINKPIQTVHRKAENAVRVEHDLIEWFKLEVRTR